MYRKNVAITFRKASLQLICVLIKRGRGIVQVCLLVLELEFRWVTSERPSVEIKARQLHIPAGADECFTKNASICSRRGNIRTAQAQFIREIRLVWRLVMNSRQNSLDAGRGRNCIAKYLSLKVQLTLLFVCISLVTQ